MTDQDLPRPEDFASYRRRVIPGPGQDPEEVALLLDRLAEQDRLAERDAAS